MGIAARKPQASSPVGDCALYDELLLEDQSFAFDQRHYVSISDEFGLEDSAFVVAPAQFFSISSEIDTAISLFHFYLANIGFYDEVGIDVFQNYTEQLIETEEIDSGDAVGRLDNIELDIMQFSTNPAFFKEFTYTDESLVGFSIYTDSGKGTKLADVTFIYTGEDLTSKEVHRISDNRHLRIDFNYSNGNLISQTRSVW